MQGIKHRGWVSGAEPVHGASTFNLGGQSAPAAFQPTGYSRPVRIKLPSGKTAWMCRDEQGKTQIT